MTHTTPDEARIIRPSQLIGAAEAAEILGLQRSTLTRWIHRGAIKPLAKLDGGRGAYVFDRAEILALSLGGRAA
jgi:excisionase family DNA binding protein